MLTVGRLVGVGVGPGDPELLTTRALRELRQADRIFGPTIALDALGRAESIVREADPSLEVERLVFAITGGTSAQLEAHRQAGAHVASSLDAGEKVAFITLGDPNVYSTFAHLADAVRELRPQVTIETVPGIMAFQDLAARSSIVVLDGSERLTLVSAAYGLDGLDAALSDPDSAVIVYKGGRYLPEMAKRLAAAGRLEGAVMGELLGLPGERIRAVREGADAPATYLATVIVPPARRNVPTGRSGRGGSR